MTTATAHVEVVRAETRITVSLAVMDCATCGVIFGVPDEFDARRRADAKTFYCPTGHSMSYNESKADKLARELAAAKNQLASARADVEFYKDAGETAQRSLTATKGVVTRLRNRAIAGTCPFGCHRNFANLQRHVAAKHAGEKLESES